MNDMESKNMPVRKILLVDPDEFSRILFRDGFWIQQARWETKYEVAAVASFEEALKCFGGASTIPDMIFIEPHGGQPRIKSSKAESEEALAFIQKIRLDKSLSNMKIVIYSAYPDSPFRKKALAAGADIFLPKKNFLYPDLMKVVQG
jgi:CheY-like chemotaxis protein